MPRDFIHIITTVLNRKYTNRIEQYKEHYNRCPYTYSPALSTFFFFLVNFCHIFSISFIFGVKEIKYTVLYICFQPTRVLFLYPISLSPMNVFILLERTYCFACFELPRCFNTTFIIYASGFIFFFTKHCF